MHTYILSILKKIVNTILRLSLAIKVLLGLECLFLLISLKDLGDFFLYWALLYFALFAIDFSSTNKSNMNAGTAMSEQGRYAVQVGALFGNNKDENGTVYQYPNRVSYLVVFIVNLLIFIIAKYI